MENVVPGLKSRVFGESKLVQKGTSELSNASILNDNYRFSISPSINLRRLSRLQRLFVPPVAANATSCNDTKCSPMSNSPHHIRYWAEDYHHGRGHALFTWLINFWTHFTSSSDL